MQDTCQLILVGIGKVRLDFHCPCIEGQINTYNGVPANIEQVYIFINVDGKSS